jgi:hypothetical protein
MHAIGNSQRMFMGGENTTLQPNYECRRITPP